MKQEEIFKMTFFVVKISSVHLFKAALNKFTFVLHTDELFHCWLVLNKFFSYLTKSKI